VAQDDSDKWKKKYYAGLERLEAQDTRLADLEKLLRTSVARLTLAAEGQDPVIDRELQSLRKLVRGECPPDEVRRALDHLADTLRRHEKVHATGSPSTSAPDARELLALLLRDLRAPAALEAELTDLRDRTAGGDDAVFRQVPAFLARLSRLAATAPASFPATRDAATDWEPFDALIAALHLPPDDKAALARHRATLAADRMQRQWQALLEELSSLINRRLDAGPSVASGSPQTPATNAVMLELLHYIPLPGELADQLEAIRDRLAEDIPASEWPQVLSAIAELIAEMRRRIESEKTDLESFLLQLTGRLKELDASLQGADRARQSSFENGRQLDQAVQEQVSGIESSMQHSATLNELKTAIQGRIETIRVRMDNYRQQEAERSAEMERRLQDLATQVTGFEQETTELRGALRRRHEQALLDALTGVANRLAWDERLDQEVSRWQRYGTPLALLVLDVDHFKQINDQYGHKAGDKALQLIARVLRQNLRDTDFLARYGGEEFVALVTDQSVQNVAALAKKLLKAIESADFHFRGQPVAITLSCGYAVFRKDDSADAVFQRADAAVYRAKAEGRNRCFDGNQLTS
jgi:diguanylate cyclase